ncbi:hypothetical protein HFP57_03765 [Parasphingopyxis algicola]|uniref:hypothetical protein n=1 Tax=Parasphingopyxis algicola TaxID=2026624 RepID=UPI0015A25134|nr:hypothetical protein [Parasphingopyxis algicola]QLC24232.1 hypothetical protein HFP57_03765 [Parasphingopyxis algicola]
MLRSLAKGAVVSAGAAVAGLIAGNALFPPEPSRSAIDALPFTLIGAFLILWPSHALLRKRIGARIVRYAVLAVAGFVAGGALLGLTLAFAGVSHPKTLDLALIGASYGGLTALFWALFDWAIMRASASMRRSR